MSSGAPDINVRLRRRSKGRVRPYRANLSSPHFKGTLDMEIRFDVDTDGATPVAKLTDSKRR